MDKIKHLLDAMVSLLIAFTVLLLMGVFLFTGSIPGMDEVHLWSLQEATFFGLLFVAAAIYFKS